MRVTQIVTLAILRHPPSNELTKIVNTPSPQEIDVVLEGFETLALSLLWYGGSKTLITFYAWAWSRRRVDAQASPATVERLGKGLVGGVG